MGAVRTVLVTGFERFGPHAANPTEEAVRRLPGTLAGARVVAGVLPVVYGRCAEAAVALIAEHRPDAVVLTGLAAGRRAVTPERVAINVRDTGGTEGFADNAGAAPRDEPIIEGGPAGIFATLPNRRIVAELHSAGIPAELSSTAGTFICNETMYAVLHSLSSRGAGAPPAGFVHVPDVEVLPMRETVRALEVVVGAVVADLPPGAPVRPLRHPRTSGGM
jgi:pyroglutamyl-peptidase